MSTNTGETEYISWLNRYVKQRHGYWTGLPFVARVATLPIYLAHFAWLCLKGEGVVVSVLHDEGVEPDDD